MAKVRDLKSTVRTFSSTLVYLSVLEMEVLMVAPLVMMMSLLSFVSSAGWSRALIVGSASILLSVHVHRTPTCGILGINKLCSKCCPVCKTKVEIKCMGSVGGKTPTEPNLFFYLFFSSLRHIEQDEIGVA
jgi:hypothetical protein